MKIAVLSDIHGNHLAFNNVVQELHRLEIETLFILGDIVGYYYNPHLILERLSEFTHVEIILGNHEIMMKEALENPQRGKEITEKYGHGIEFAIQNLNKQQKELLLTRPSEKKLYIDQLNFFLCHGSPKDPDQYLYPDTDRTILEKSIENHSSFDFIFCGHSHYPFCFQHNQTLIANPGSIGQPRDTGNLASYLVIDTKNKSISFKRRFFQTKDLIHEVQLRDPELPYLYKFFQRNI